MRRKSDPQLLSDVLQSVVEKLNRSKHNDTNKLISDWPKVCGRQLARQTRPVKLQKKNLLVHVKDSAWLYQASLYKEEILAQAKKKLGQDKVENVQFRIGKI
ncbi:DUF721 domain-containing protein [Candidatus Omnitrophota bacterium]